MSDTTITTNGIPRAIVYGFELSKKEKKEFDWMKDEELEGACFFRYRRQCYALNEFVRIVPQGKEGYPFCHHDHCGTLKGWDGILTDSFFSAIVVKYADDERVIVGLVLS